ncbi:MAG: outer membrane protein assembly factor, partial [Vicinamibacterales bacterium]
EGNTVVETSLLRRLFTLEPGDWYRQEAIRDFLEKARELYGANGYMEFTGYPDITPTDGGTAGAPAAPPQSLAAVGPTPGADASAPTVDVVLRLSEGHQYIVNRITFSGNVTTRDSVIRREMRLLEGGVFNTEALKASVRRLNQLGYFKPLTGSDKDLKVEKAAGREDAVDIGIKIEELNRNQMTFGAGMSQYEGLFGNVSFTTANFLGRGESVTVSAQKGMRASNYQVSVTEPAVFDGRFSAGFNVFSSKVDLYSSANVVGFSQVREGASLTVGRRVFRSSRIFANYAYEIINVAASKDFASTTSGTTSAYFYGLAESGRYTESRIGPSFEYNTVDNPLRPRSGVRVTASLPVAGGLLGGTANYVKPELETVLYIPHTRRTAFGFRANVAAIQPFGKTSTLPYYLRYFLGGEYQIRGVNIRTVGPANAQGQAIGGNKFVLFNAEYYLDMFGPVRMVLFHDAGQAYDERHSIDLRQLRTSSGVEARFTVPALNVPFRLIYSWNIYRDVFQPARGFRFAVGTTF